MLPLFFTCVTNENAVPYLLRFDFDGDGINDRVSHTFSGGAHCCYQNIPRECRDKYHISSHYILVDYADNEILVKDYVPGAKK